MRYIKCSNENTVQEDVKHFSYNYRLYQLGHNPEIEQLYPPVQFPVSRGTPMISPLLKWDHREDWFVLSYRSEDEPRVFSLKYSIDTRDSEWSYIKGHNIDGKSHKICHRISVRVSSLQISGHRWIQGCVIEFVEKKFT